MKAVETHPDTLREHMLGTYHNLRVGIGVVGAILPFLLLLGGWLLDHESLQGSMSAYYYSPTMRDVFVASLGAIGLFLILYKGFSSREDRALDIAGVGALIVAFFPTGLACPKDEVAAFLERARAINEGADVAHATWRAPLARAFACLSSPERFGAPWAHYAHYAGAALLFLSIAYVCRETASETLMDLEPATIAKFHRIYRALGNLLIIAPIVLIAVARIVQRDPKHQIWLFFAEAGAIEVFAWYWLVKSRELSKTEAQRLALEGRLAADPAAKPGKPGRFMRVQPVARS